MTRYIFSVLDPDIYRELSTSMAGVPNVELIRDSILNLECDAIVSPANSFGFMDGGIDQQYTDFFGTKLQEDLQRLIRIKHHGELLVGQADIVETGHAKIPYLIAAPTMRTPMLLQGKSRLNAYLAMRAVLLLMEHGRFIDGRLIKKSIRRVAVPGLGTGVGRLSPKLFAKQVRAAFLAAGLVAINSASLNHPDFPTSLMDAHLEEVDLLTE
jgi:O-acetyl-ADP-ribose deacetylase (regulator of RNase III)